MARYRVKTSPTQEEKKNTTTEIEKPAQEKVEKENTSKGTDVKKNTSKGNDVKENTHKSKDKVAKGKSAKEKSAIEKKIWKKKENDAHDNNLPNDRPSLAEAKVRVNKKATPHSKVSTFECGICFNSASYFAVGPCNHRGVCSDCSFRFRVLSNSMFCPFCKSLNENVFVLSVNQYNESFDQIKMDSEKPQTIFDDKSQTYFVNCRDHFIELSKKNQPICPICQLLLPSVEKPDGHISKQHNAKFCELCLESQVFFVSEQQYFTPNQLKQHQKKKHKQCTFCRSWHFDDDHLFRHMNQTHFTGHLCPERYKYRFYSDYQELENHFRGTHFLCEDPNCIRQRYIAFNEENEFIFHLSSVHGVRNMPLKLSFRVEQSQRNRGYNPNEEEEEEDKKVVEVLPPSRRNQNNDETKNAQSQLTNSKSNIEDYPTLPSRPVTQMSSETQQKLSEVEMILQRNAKKAKELEEAKKLKQIRSPELEKQLQWRKRLSDAFGIAPDVFFDKLDPNDPLAPYEAELNKPVYTKEIIEWGRLKYFELLKIERKLKELIEDPEKNSVQMKPMPKEMRANVHCIAKYYKCDSIAYEAEPKRYVSVIKTPCSRIPSLLLSDAVEQHFQQQSQRNRVEEKEETELKQLKISNIAEGMNGIELIRKIREFCGNNVSITKVKSLDISTMIIEFDSIESMRIAYQKLISQEDRMFDVNYVMDKSTMARILSYHESHRLTETKEEEKEKGEEKIRPMLSEQALQLLRECIAIDENEFSQQKFKETQKNKQKKSKKVKQENKRELNKEQLYAGWIALAESDDEKDKGNGAQSDENENDGGGDEDDLW